MPLPHIDARLAGLAEAATGTSRPPGIVRPPHTRRIDRAVAPGAGPTDDQVLESAGSVVMALSVGDVAELGRRCVPDVHVRTPTSDTTGLDELERWMCREGHVFGEIEVTIDWLLVAGLGVAAEWRLCAVHRDPLEIGWATIEATGQSIAIEGALVAHLASKTIESGSPRFDDLHLHYDTTDVLVQLALT